MQSVPKEARFYIPQVKSFDSGYTFRNGKVLWDVLGRIREQTALDDEAVKSFISIVPSPYPHPDLVLEFYTVLSESSREEFYYPKRRAVAGDFADRVTYGDFCAEVASAVCSAGLTHFRHLVMFLRNEPSWFDPGKPDVSRVVDSLVRVETP